MTLALERKLFTTAEYHRLIEAGVLHEDDRIELLNGELIKMAAIGPRHAMCVNTLAALLITRLKKSAQVSIQNPVQIGNYSEPEPDIVVVRPRADRYADGHPTTDDILIVIEVADSSVESDRNFKLPAYASAGIAEAWLVDLGNDRVEVYTGPDQGFYREIRLVSRHQRVTSKVIPTLSLKSDDILG
ncbi:MAG: Uma2 family endonuclease [Blastocatellia bacterium]